MEGSALPVLEVAKQCTEGKEQLDPEQTAKGKEGWEPVWRGK